MKIKITQTSNQKLLQNFPNDPYSDIIITTKNHRYKLLLAYLSIDSHYFQRLTNDIKVVDLSNLPENELYSVLRALYGDELEVKSIEELGRIYQIQDYIQAIAKQILNNKNLKQSIEILQFCFENDFLLQEIREFHLQNNLNVLSNSRNYLHLNKINGEVISWLLIDYYDLKGIQGQDVINHILENYFYRNNVKAYQYFADPNLEVLKYIWQAHHHIIQSNEILKYKSFQTLPQMMSKSFIYAEQNSKTAQTLLSSNPSQTLFLKIQALKKQIFSKQFAKQSKYKKQSYSINEKRDQVLISESSQDGASKTLVGSQRIKKKNQKFNLQGDLQMSFSQEAFKNLQKITKLCTPKKVTFQ